MKSICRESKTALCHICGMRCRLTVKGDYGKHEVSRATGPTRFGDYVCVASGSPAVEWLDKLED